jgi:uncharacterized protein (TIGR02466 family)
MPEEVKAEEPVSAPLDELHYFVTPIYITKQPQFLETVKTIAADSIKKVHGKTKPNKIHPVLMSGNMLEDERIEEFASFVGSTAWNILSSQGYAMENFSTVFTEMWCQEHYQTSSMDHHTHPGGNLLVGFYFLDTPEGCPPVVIHDPRPGRVMLDLPQVDVNQLSLASTMVNFIPEPGMLMFAPAWLAHSFNRNASKSPFRFVHFNLSVQPNGSVAPPMPEAEIV